LSGAAFGAAIIGLIAIHWLLTHLGERQAMALASRQVAIWILAASFLIGLPWMVRGIILSGYPAFPSTFGALPLDWRIPTETTREAADWIASFARQPRGDIATVLGSWDWIQGWIGLMQEQFNIFLFVLPLYIFMGALAASIIVLIILRILRRRRDLMLWLPLLPALLSAIFWFLGAPDPRFAGSAFWILALWGLVFVFTLFWNKPPILVTYAVMLPAIGIAAYLIISGLSTDVDVNRIRFPSVPIAPIRTYQTASGLVVNMSADQANHLLLWDMPLPTTPYELPGLELRGQDFRDGFRTRP
jgi:MFS family permease